VLATVARRMDVRPAAALLLAALAVHLVDQRPLRATVRRDYSWPWPRLSAPVWHGVGRSFRSLRLVPPILAHRIACQPYDQHEDFEIRFGVLAASERMTFNSGNPARVDDWTPLCRPLIDSLKRGLLDDHTIYIPSATYREAIEWWAGGHALCGTIDGANVCVARDSATAAAPLTRLLIAQAPGRSGSVLHFDLRGGQPASVDSIRGFMPPDSGGRRIARGDAEIFYSRPFTGDVTLAINAVALDSARSLPLVVALGAQLRSFVVTPRGTEATVRFPGVAGANTRAVRLMLAAPGKRDVPASDAIPTVRIRHLTISVQ